MVGMMDDPGVRAPALEGRDQGTDDDVAGRVGRHGPAEHPAGAQVDDGQQAQVSKGISACTCGSSRGRALLDKPHC